jgi:hypothetical protein
VIDILKAEIQRDLALLGTADIRNLGEDCLQPARSWSSPTWPR